MATPALTRQTPPATPPSGPRPARRRALTATPRAFY